MYVRKAHVKGETYYSVVEGFRDEFGRVKQRVVVSLGRSSSFPAAIEASKAQIDQDSELFVRIVREFVRLNDEVDTEVPKSLRVIAKKDRAADSDRSKVLATMTRDLEPAEVADDVDGPAPDQKLPWPSWALRKATQLDRRIREEQRRVEKLEELAPQFKQRDGKAGARKRKPMAR